MSQLESLFDEFNQEEQESRQLSGSAQKVAGPGDENSADAIEAYTKSTLFVRGVPKDATNEELEEFFSNVGPVRSCFVVGEKKNEDKGDEEEAEEEEGDDKKGKPAKTRNRGFGFVQFVLAEDAARAIEELATVKFRDQKILKLDHAMKKSAKGEQDDEQQDEKQQQKPGAKRLRPESQLSKDEHLAKKPRPSGVKVESRTIVIEGIAKGVTKQQLIKKVKKSGAVHSVFYPAPFSGATPDQLVDGAGGSANVTFETHGMAQKAAKALNDHVFKGAKITAKLKTQYIDKNARIIVRNLPFKLREKDLEHIFSESGTVLEVTLPRKYVGGPLRGFAFIQMGDYESAERAVAKWNQQKLQDRMVSVSFAIAKDKYKEMEENGEIEAPELNTEAEASIDVGEDRDQDTDAEMENIPGSDDDAEDKIHEDEDGDEDEGDEDQEDEALQQGCTLFIRNLSFDSTEESLFDHFRIFGKLRYWRIVYDPETGKSRGTAFVSFCNPKNAAKCLEAAEKAQKLSDQLVGTSSTAASAAGQRNKSVLLQDAPASLDSTSQFMLDGRKDKRNVYLLKEGVIFPDTPLAAAMAPPDLEHHVKEYGQRKNQLFVNPNLYLSKTRLSVHNLPRSIDEKDLRAAAISAIAKFKNEVKANKRQPLSSDEMAEGWDKLPKVVQAKVVRSTDRVDASTGKARSMGYGFIEFSTHAHALACLRQLNFCDTWNAFAKLSNEEKPQEDFSKSKYRISRRSLRVMFSIENVQIIKKREMRTKITGKKQPGTGSEPANKHRSPKAASTKKGKPSKSKAKK
ncbi:RNA recognition motif-containing protein [Dipsacomyces acuminosporus]|nr:RNA recognition motif-containing protein [Dipsacomyces acuminosporus]